MCDDNIWADCFTHYFFRFIFPFSHHARSTSLESLAVVGRFFRLLSSSFIIYEAPESNQELRFAFEIIKKSDRKVEKIFGGYFIPNEMTLHAQTRGYKFHRSLWGVAINPWGVES